jgi:transcriptional regulator with XRE-family HTH domain
VERSISQPYLGKSLFELRTTAGLTQSELREKCHVSERTIQRIESGAVMPRVATVRILLEALGQDAEEWFATGVRRQERDIKKYFKNPFLRNPRDVELKHAVGISWIAGIVYLLSVIGEEAFELGVASEFNTRLMLLLLILVKVLSAGSFFFFTRGFLSLSQLFEIKLLKTASYLSMTFVSLMFLVEAVLLLFSFEIELAATFRAFSVVPLGAISIVFGLGLMRLQDSMGRIAKMAGRVEVIFGISYVSLLLSFIGVFLLVPLLIVEIVMLSKADQLADEGLL